MTTSEAFGAVLDRFTAAVEAGDGRALASLFTEETVVFEGMSQFTFEGDLIRRYREVFETGVAMAQLRFPAERMAKSLERRAAALRAREGI